MFDAPKPISSIKTITTFGAPLGAVTSNRLGAVEFLTSCSVYCGYVGSFIGRTVLSIPSSEVFCPSSDVVQDCSNTIPVKRNVINIKVY